VDASARDVLEELLDGTWMLKSPDGRVLLNGPPNGLLMLLERVVREADAGRETEDSILANMPLPVGPWWPVELLAIAENGLAGGGGP
jgi:hypothetical protein